MPYLLDPQLARLLKGVSRSFYLSLRLLPAPTRGPVGLAYLLARAADTIADTRALPPAERSQLLHRLRLALAEPGSQPELAPALRQRLLTDRSGPGAPTGSEERLLQRFDECLTAFGQHPEGEQQRTSRLLHTLTGGMLTDLERFPPEDSGGLAALDTREQLREYCYAVAGCVGDYWTQVHLDHLPALRRGESEQNQLVEWGIAYGRGLQLINILRDLPRDLRIGRCYLPTSDLEGAGLDPFDLLDPGAWPSLQPLYRQLIGQARSWLQSGAAYVQAIPARCGRLRLASLLPLLIGWETLQLLEESEQVLEPDPVIKIPRRFVYRMLAQGLPAAWLDLWLARLLRPILKEPLP